MSATHVRPIAERALAALAPYCERIEIAGSLRRQCTEVKDIEIVCLPRNRDMFEFEALLRRWPRRKGQPGGKYSQHVVEGVTLDLFRCSAATWACNMLLRTGCRDFSHSVATHARLTNRRFVDAHLWATHGDGLVEEPELLRVIPVLEERDVFEALDLPWIEPHHRDRSLGDILGRAYSRSAGR